MLNSTAGGVVTQYTYNDRGDLLTAQEGTETATQYTYDVFGKQTTVVGEGLNAAYTYYPDDLRKTKTINGITTTYVWDGDQIILELTAGAVRKYIRGLQLIACVGGDSISYYHHDGHGNVVQLSDTSGAVICNYEYDAFGEQLNIDAVDTNPFRYCGEYLDAETGTYYLRARSYAADLGRFTQWDSYAGDTMKPVSLNHYIYCYDDPIKYRDSSGNIPVDTIFDLASTGMSLWELIQNPTLANLGYLLVDAAAFIIPYVPSSKTIDLAQGSMKMLRLSKIDDYVDAGKSGVWAMNKFERGYEIEKALGGMGNNFPKIDKYVVDRITPGTKWLSSITSIKSVDLTSKSYLKGAKLQSLLYGYVDDVASYNYVTYKGTRHVLNSNGKRILEVAVPPVEMTQQQVRAFEKASKHAEKNNVELLIKIVK